MTDITYTNELISLNGIPEDEKEVKIAITYDLIRVHGATDEHGERELYWELDENSIEFDWNVFEFSDKENQTIEKWCNENRNYLTNLIQP
jgi:hypothetical protein